MRSSRHTAPAPASSRARASCAALACSPASQAMKTSRSSASRTPGLSSAVGSGPPGSASFRPRRSSTWKGTGAGCAAGVRERAIEARVGEAGEAVAHLLARAAELVRREAGGGLPAGAVEGLAQPPLVVARGARGEDRDRPVAPVLDAGAQLVA